MAELNRRKTTDSIEAEPNGASHEKQRKQLCKRPINGGPQRAKKLGAPIPREQSAS